MGIRKLKPTTPGQRHKVIGAFDKITASTPEKSLVVGKKSTGGRNNTGKMTMRYIGGGHKQKYRFIDFKRNKDGIPATVKSIEYDPNRSSRIALLNYADGEKRYILAPNGLKVGDVVFSGPESDIKPGNCLPLANIPDGTQIHNIELKIGKGGQIVRSAGTSAQLMGKDNGYAILRLPSGEMRRVRQECRATIGVVGNADHSNLVIGKAGRHRWMGVRPGNRGVVMNPCDHPHGGGEGKSPVGRKHPVTPWGKPAHGVKTRDKKKASNSLIIKRRTK